MPTLFAQLQAVQRYPRSSTDRASSIWRISARPPGAVSSPRLVFLPPASGSLAHKQSPIRHAKSLSVVSQFPPFHGKALLRPTYRPVERRKGNLNVSRMRDLPFAFKRSTRIFVEGPRSRFLKKSASRNQEPIFHSSSKKQKALHLYPSDQMHLS